MQKIKEKTSNMVFITYVPLRRLKVAILKLPLPLPLLQTAIMEICAILKAQTDAAATSSNLYIYRERLL